MLKKAQKNTGCEVTHSTIAKASDTLSKQRFDLVLAHFVAAYEPVSTILNQSYALLSPKGYLSFTSTTLNTFPKMMGLFEYFKRSVNPFERVIGHYVNKILGNVYVPKDAADFESYVQKTAFSVKEKVVETIPITLNSKNEVYDFFIKGGWFVSGFDFPLVPDKLIERIIKRIIAKHIELPYQDSMEIMMVILEK